MLNLKSIQRRLDLNESKLMHRGGRRTQPDAVFQCSDGGASSSIWREMDFTAEEHTMTRIRFHNAPPLASEQVRGAPWRGRWRSGLLTPSGTRMGRYYFSANNPRVYNDNDIANSI